MAKNKISAKEKIGIGAGMGALVAAAAGAYYLYGTKVGAKKRRQMRSWALKAKGELMEKLEKMEHVSQKTYQNAVNEVAKRYAVMKNIDTKEVEKLAKDLKKQWQNIQKEIEREAKKAAMRATRRKKSRARAAKRRRAAKRMVAKGTKK